MKCAFSVSSFVSISIHVVAVIVLECKWFILLHQLIKMREKTSWGKACMPENLFAFSSYTDSKDIICLTNLALLCKHVVG